MATGMPDFNYYPDTNMGMGGMSSMSSTPTSTRDALDRYFRAYWKQKQQRAGEIEAARMKSEQAAEERTWKTGEYSKERTFKQGELTKNQAAAASLAEQARGWSESDSDKANRYAWLGALANIGTMGAGWDQMYNKGALRKSIYNTATSGMNTLLGFENKVSNTKKQYGIPYSVPDPSLTFAKSAMPQPITTGIPGGDPEYTY